MWSARKTKYILLPLVFYMLSFFFRQNDDIYIPASVIRVIDGDTAEMTLHPPQKSPYRALVRFRGVDTPEIKGQCPAERKAALVAKSFTEDILVSAPILIMNPEIDKYGRIAGSVLVDRADIAKKIISAGYGRQYDKGRRKPWCNEQGLIVH